MNTTREQLIVQEAERLTLRCEEIESEIFRLQKLQTKLRENLTEEILATFLDSFSELLNFKKKYQDLLEQKRLREKTDKETRDGELKKLNCKNFAFTDVWDKYFDCRAKSQNWYRTEQDKIHLHVDDFLIKNVEDLTLRFLLAYFINRLPQDKTSRILYEGEGIIENNLRKIQYRRLGILEFFCDSFYSNGDRYYGYVSNVLDIAQETLIQKFQSELKKPELTKTLLDIPNELVQLQKKLVSSQKEEDKLRKTLSGYEIVREYNYDPKEIEEKLLWLFDELANHFRLKDLKIMIDKGVVVLLDEKSGDTNSGFGVEYDILVTIYRHHLENKMEKYFCWHNSTNSTLNNLLFYSLKKCEIVEVTNDAVSVRLISEKSTITEIFFLGEFANEVISS